MAYVFGVSLHVEGETVLKVKIPGARIENSMPSSYRGTDFSTLTETFKTVRHSPARPLYSQFLDYSGHPGILVQSPEAFVVARSAVEVTGQRLLVPVESQADKLAVGIQHRTAGIPSGYIIVSQEIYRH